MSRTLTNPYPSTPGNISFLPYPLPTPLKVDIISVSALYEIGFVRSKITVLIAEIRWKTWCYLEHRNNDPDVLWKVVFLKMSERRRQKSDVDEDFFTGSFVEFFQRNIFIKYQWLVAHVNTAKHNKSHPNAEHNQKHKWIITFWQCGRTSFFGCFIS